MIDPTRVIKFLNPQHGSHVGARFTTVRTGSRNQFVPGSLVEIVGTSKPDKVLYRAKVLEKLVKRMGDITDHDLRIQHDKTTRNVKGLREVLDKAYGSVIQTDSVMSIIKYEITQVMLPPQIVVDSETWQDMRDTVRGIQCDSCDETAVEELAEDLDDTMDRVEDSQ